MPAWIADHVEAVAIEIERIIVADSVDRRANELRKSLADIGCRAVTILRSQDGLVPSVQTEQPDVVLVAAQAPAGSVIREMNPK